MSVKRALLQNQLDRHQGVGRMAPVWLPRTFLPPGRRLKLHPDDLYPFGPEKGGICERWFCSTGVPGPDGLKDVNTMSRFYLGAGNGELLFPEAVDLMGVDLLGEETMATLGTFKMFAKLYDYAAALPFHMHPKAEFANKVGMNQKPESYYFPAELNSITYDHDLTFFGLVPGTTKEELLECIRNYTKGDNYALTFSQAYKIRLGTGWFLPAGILHAPASVVTYEPQYISDSLAFYQNIVESRYVIGDSMNDAVIPAGLAGDRAEYMLEMIDWEANFGDFRAKYYHEPRPVRTPREMLDEGYYEEWVSYGSEDFSAKRLKILPGQTVRIKDAAAYGFIMMQGYGAINGMEINTPVVIRFGQQTADEGFVTYSAAKEGVVIHNPSEFSELVMLKHFNGGNPEVPM